MKPPPLKTSQVQYQSPRVNSPRPNSSQLKTQKLSRPSSIPSTILFKSRSTPRMGNAAASGGHKKKRRINQIITDRLPNKTISEDRPASDPIFISTAYSDPWIYHLSTADSSRRRPRADFRLFSAAVQEAWAAAA